MLFEYKVHTHAVFKLACSTFFQRCSALLFAFDHFLFLQPETSLYEVLFWWLPDIDDDNEEEADEGETKQGRVKKRVRERSLKGLRGNGTPERKLVKGREGKTKDKRAKRERDEETKGKKKGKQAKLRDVENMDEEEEINEGEDEVKPKKLQKVMKSKASKS